MRPSVYLETSVIGYLSSRPSSDVLTLANQKYTHEWWKHHRESYDIFVSQFVLDECTVGDATAIRDRLLILTSIPQLAVTPAVDILGRSLLEKVPLPAKAEVDALHIAIAAISGIDYLLTWNCKHIANAALRAKIERICRQHGFEPPTICTPQELLGP